MAAPAPALPSLAQARTALQANNPVLGSLNVLIFTPEQKDEIWQDFQAIAALTHAAAQNQHLAFLDYLRFLADNGSSELTSSDRHMILRWQPAPVAGAPQPMITEMGSTYDDYIDALSERPYYTHRRMTASFADYVAVAIDASATPTNWSIKHRMPVRFMRYGFPGGEFVTNIPPDALAALNGASRRALQGQGVLSLADTEEAAIANQNFNANLTRRTYI